MLYPFLSDGRFDIGFSEIKQIDGINQIRIFAEEPREGHFDFKMLEFYLPSKKITLKTGYSDAEVKKIIELVSISEDSLFRMARYYQNREAE